MKKHLLILSAASLLALASCGQSNPPQETSQQTTSAQSTTSEPATTSAPATTSSVPSIVSSLPTETSVAEDSSEQDSSEPEFDPSVLLDAALNDDYNNVAAYVGMISPESEGYTWHTSYAEGYEVVFDEYIAMSSGESPASFVFFHDYEDKNYIYLKGDASAGEVSGWVAHNDVYDTDLGLANQYSDERAMFEVLKANKNKIHYYEAGVYWLDDLDVLGEIVDKAYPNAAYVPGVTENYWYDSTSVNLLMFSISETGHINKLQLVDEDIDLDYNCIDIDFYDYGTTTLASAVPSTITIPEAPNVNNTLAFWQYKGLSGPYVDVYPASLEISVKEGPEAVENVYNLEIEGGMSFNKVITFDQVGGDIEEARLIKHSDSVEWVSSDEKVVKFDYSGKLVAFGAGDANVYLTAKDKNGQTIQSNVVKVHVNPLAPQNLEGAVYNFNFAYTHADKDDTGFFKVQANNVLENDLPVTIKANSGVSVLKSDDESIFGGAKVLNVAMGTQETMHDPEFAGDGVVCFDFDDQQVSGLSFYYGGLYSNYKQNVEWVESIKIQTSNDGQSWTDAADITEEVLENVSDMNLKLMEKSFAPASKVRIVVASKNFIGKTFTLTMPSIAFIADENCHSHVDKGANPISAIQIAASGSATSVRVNKSVQFLPTVTPENPSNPTLTWHVDNANVATIDQDGLLTGISAGTVKVWATDNSGEVKSNEVSIEVTALPTVPESYNGTWKGDDLAGNDITLVINGNSMTATTGNYSTTLTYEDYDDENRSFVYKSATDSISVSYSSYSEDLSVRGKLNGVDIKEGNGNSKSYAKYVPASKLTLSTSAENNTVLGGTNFTLSVAFEPSDATTTDITWTSDHDDLVEIMDSNGGAFVYTTAVETDTVVEITATSENGIVGKISITLTAPKKVSAINVTLGSSSIEVAHKTTASAVVTPDNADNKEVTWSSSDSSVARVDKNGTVTAVAPGTCQIIATAKDGSGITGSATLVVTEVTETIDGTYTGTTVNGSSDFTIGISNNGTTATLLIDESGEEGEFVLDETASSGNVYVFVGDFNYDEGYVLTVDLDNNTATFEDASGETYIVYYQSDEIVDCAITLQ